MPISFTPISNHSEWTGSTWSVDDDDELVELIARVALGQHSLVSRILESTHCRRFVPVKSAIEGAKKLLTVPAGKPPWHRDGWLFQVMSWIAASLRSHGGILQPPHMIHAHKGFDGLEIECDPTTGQIQALVISEDKATSRPRKMVRDEVLPEFRSISNGARDSELVAAVPMMLKGVQDPEIIDESIETIMWAEVRAFRIAITVKAKHNDTQGQKGLFKGYDKIGGDTCPKRQAETFEIEDLRHWMNEIAKRALLKVAELDTEHV